MRTVKVGDWAVKAFDGDVTEAARPPTVREDGMQALFALRIFGFANVEETEKVCRYLNLRWQVKNAIQTNAWLELGRIGHGEYGKLETGELHAGFIRHLCLKKVDHKNFYRKGIMPEIIGHALDAIDEI